MTRLTNHKKKEMTQKATTLFVVFIVLSILFFTFGFKLVIQTSVFINNLLSKNDPTAEANEEDEFFGTLYVDEVPSATNSAKLVVSGSVNNFSHIQIFINEQRVDEIKVTASGSFSEEVGDLEKGENELYIKAVAKKEKKSKTSDTYTVSYLSEKPKLDISEPSDNSTVNKQEITIKGSTDKDNNVTINNSPVVVELNGDFQQTYRLREGENKLEIATEDIAGNVEKKTLTVHYKRDE